MLETGREEGGERRPERRKQRERGTKRVRDKERKMRREQYSIERKSVRLKKSTRCTDIRHIILSIWGHCSAKSNLGDFCIV